MDRRAIAVVNVFETLEARRIREDDAAQHDEERLIDDMRRTTQHRVTEPARSLMANVAGVYTTTRRAYGTLLATATIPSDTTATTAAFASGTLSSAATSGCSVPSASTRMIAGCTR